MAGPGNRAPFITLEGGEGAGKSTQVRRLADRLERLGHKVFTTLEPGATGLGASLRRLVSENRGDPPTPTAELCMYLADRAEHVHKQIAPVLDEGKVVICDRFIDSSEVYQGRARGLGREEVRGLNRWVCGDVWPDLTLVLDLDPRIGLKRVLERQGSLGLDRMENEKLSFHRAVRQGFLDQAEAEPERIKLINADQTPDQVARAIWDQVSVLLGRWKSHAS